MALDTYPLGRYWMDSFKKNLQVNFSTQSKSQGKGHYERYWWWVDFVCGGLYSLGLSGLQVEATQRICCRVCLWIGTCARRQGKREALRQISSTSQVLGSWSWLLLKKKRLINKTRFRWCCQITETKGVFYGDNCPRSKLKIHLESSGLKPWWIMVNYTWRL